MLKQELIKRSPIRVLEKSTHGGVGEGNLGVITARKGVGKTACLAHVAIDKMLRDQNVLHISFADDPHHIETWYKQVFDEVTRLYKLENANEVFEELRPHRLIIHFKNKDVTFEDIRKSIYEIEGGIDFAPQVIIIDGCPFENMTEEILKQWKTFAGEQKAAVWFSATLHREDLKKDAQGIPAPVNQFSDIFSVIIMLNPVSDYIDLELLKDHDSDELDKLRLKLDPHTLLISNHRV